MIDEKSRHSTTFRFDSSPLYEYCRLPMGLKPSGAAFVRSVLDAFEGYLYEKMVVHLDDVVIFGKTFDEASGNIKKVPQRTRENKFKLKTVKMKLFEHDTEILGLKIRGDDVSISDKNTAAIKNLAPPKNVKQF